MTYRLKKEQRKFMERKVKAPSSKSVSDKNEEITITITILVAIVILVAFLVNLVFFTPAQKEPFAAIYLLDSEGQAENFPKTVVLDENSTFVLGVGVINQKDAANVFSVNMKLDDGNGDVNPSPVEPLEIFEKTLLDEEIWEFQVTISIDQLGTNRVIFELFSFNTTKNDIEYTGNWVSLSLEAI